LNNHLNPNVLYRVLCLMLREAVQMPTHKQHI
jgi:hypothetical protein